MRDRKIVLEETDRLGKSDFWGNLHLHSQAEVDLVQLGLYLALDSVDLRLKATALPFKVLR
jgi:hypothetical protein